MRKSYISKKSARRWINRNEWQIAKMFMGMGSGHKSCFGKQYELCVRSVLKK